MGKITVYKFMSARTMRLIKRIRSVAVDRKFWFAKIDTLNDIDEGIFYYTNRNQHSSLDTVLSLKNKTCVCSCSAGSEIIRDPLMWAFYANEHRGVALEIEIEKEWLSKARIEAHNVEYPSFRLEQKSGWVSPDHSLEAICKSKMSEAVITHILFHKSEAWKHEHEWRMTKAFELDAKKKGRAVKFKGRVRRIICGSRMSDETRQKLTCELQGYHGKWSDEESYLDESKVFTTGIACQVPVR